MRPHSHVFLGEGHEHDRKPDDHRKWLRHFGLLSHVAVEVQSV